MRQVARWLGIGVVLVLGLSLGLKAQAFNWPFGWPWTPTQDLSDEVSEPRKPLAIERGCYNADAERHGAVLETPYGPVTIELFCQQVPATVTNFERLVAQGFYDVPTMTFHRVEPGFVVQTGDPTGTGTGGSGQTIPLEKHSQLAHTGKGIVAMARSMDPDSASSQFYITLTKQPYLDGKYAVFGRVIQGLERLDKIKRGDRLYGIKLKDIEGVENQPGTPDLYTFKYRVKQLVTPKEN